MMGHKSATLAFQTVFDAIYPPQCLCCGDLVMDRGGLCGPCWRETRFIFGLACHTCGTPLPGQSDQPELCDDCLTTPRPWDWGRAAMVYAGTGRDLVLGLKHADRTDLVGPMAKWMVNAVRDQDLEDTVVAPIPLHWRRFFHRRYNQAALLAQEFARRRGLTCVPDLLVRSRKTPALEGKTHAQRFEILNDAIHINPKRAERIKGRRVLIVDDVMTSGATFAAASRACAAAGAASLSVVALARVVKEAYL